MTRCGDTLIAGLSLVSGLNAEREQLLHKKFYFLSCLLNAGVHGVSRYPMLQEIYHDLMPSAFAIILASLGASVSGLSRLTTFSIEEEVDKRKSSPVSSGIKRRPASADEEVDEKKSSSASSNANGESASAEESASSLSIHRKKTTITQEQREPSCCEKITNACCSFFKKPLSFFVTKPRDAGHAIEHRLN